MLLSQSSDPRQGCRRMPGPQMFAEPISSSTREVLGIVHQKYPTWTWKSTPPGKYPGKFLEITRTGIFRVFGVSFPGTFRALLEYFSGYFQGTLQGLLWVHSGCFGCTFPGFFPGTPGAFFRVFFQVLFRVLSGHFRWVPGLVGVLLGVLLGRFRGCLDFVFFAGCLGYSPRFLKFLGSWRSGRSERCA